MRCRPGHNLNNISLQLLKVFQKMVQQSAVQFNCPIQQPAQITLCPSTTTTTDHPGPLFDMSDSEEEDSLGAMPTSLPMFNSTFQKFSPFPVWKSSSCASEEEHKRKRAAAAIAMTTTTGQGDGQAVKKPTTTFDILHSTLTRPSNYSRSSSTWNSKVKWNTSAVNKDTLFVLDSQANKLFHVTEDVTAKHPELIRYSTDNQEDLNWLANERIIPGAWQRLHSSVQLLVREEVVKLKMKEQPGWDGGGGGLVGFKVPEFMIRRMHKYFTELSIKNERIRTNSGYFDTISTGGTKKEDVFSRSNLSTSHATLSALLANCSEVQEN